VPDALADLRGKGDTVFAHKSAGIRDFGDLKGMTLLVGTDPGALAPGTLSFMQLWGQAGMKGAVAETPTALDQGFIHDPDTVAVVERWWLAR